MTNLTGAPTPTPPAKASVTAINAKERAFFKTMHDRFTTRLKDTVAEVRSEEPDDQDWTRVEHQLLTYGFFLEQEPGACKTLADQHQAWIKQKEKN